MILRSGRPDAGARSLRFARRAACCCLALATLAQARPAQARAIEREGIVAILPAARFGARPAGLDNRGFAPALTVSFGLRPTAATELAIEVGGTVFGAGRGADRLDVIGVPLLVRGSYTPTPARELRPILHAGVGKQLLLVEAPGGEYQEHTPTVAMAAAGLQADLTEAMGLQADVGYLFARAKAPGMGEIDGGGVFVRAGLFFRWEPVRRLGR
ncbi:MAG TPA: hypothetical protein VN033_09520 [Vulgatibacter sp.]|nr:hypothetical protein [Vulgatibacter sp.]